MKMKNMRNNLLTLMLMASSCALFMAILWHHGRFTFELISVDHYTASLQKSDRILKVLLMVMMIFNLSLVLWANQLRNRIDRMKNNNH